ncbi:MAG: hypothetical protein U1E80_08780 [Piscinibacter sp.]|uniref:hypothetical protein n=2 Tax=Betaproteobacteria TaxID=28216 RepID=UPI0035AE79CE
MGDSIEAKECRDMIDQVQTCGRRSFIACAASGLLLAALAPRGAAATPENGPTPAGPTPAPAAEPVRSIDELGVDLMMVRLDASEFLIDLRYRIKDTAKAQPLLEQKVKPVLVNEATGDRFYIPQVPKVGSLRQSATAKQPAIAGRTYFMLFANPDRRLKVGERVTLYAGDSVIKDIVVR